MHKEALDWEALEPWAYPASVLGTMGLSTVAGWLVKRQLEKKIEESEEITPEQAKKMLKAMGLPSHLPMVPYDKMRNAFYASPRNAKLLFRRDKNFRRAVREHFGERGVSHHLKDGLIGYHPDYMRRGIMAHEMGHANIRNRPWYSPSRQNQSVLRPLSGVANAFSGLGTLLGAGAAGIGTYKATKNPLLSALAGGGTGLALAAVLNSPTLLNEMQATGQANKFLEATTKDEDKLKKEKEALNTAYKTYLIGSLAVPTLYGAAIGGVGVPSKLGWVLR